MSKIFVRHRRHVGQRAGRPRFAVVAAGGPEVNFFKTRLRRAELKKIAGELGAETVYLPRGEYDDKPEGKESSGRRRRREKEED